MSLIRLRLRIHCVFFDNINSWLAYIFNHDVSLVHSCPPLKSLKSYVLSTVILESVICDIHSSNSCVGIVRIPTMFILVEFEVDVVPANLA